MENIKTGILTRLKKMQKKSKKLFPEIYVDIDEVRLCWDKFVLIVNTVSSSLRKRFQKNIRIIPGYMDMSKNFTTVRIGALDAAFIRTKRLWFAVDDKSDKVKNYLINTFGFQFNDEINIYEFSYLFYINIDSFEDLYLLCKLMKD